ncbi:tetratricopeptide repeat domain 27 [Clavulina sp. PMI_390]|nr:tetratricopeptide repeat domain 27 [Clavulina sp. PMI_390]
MDELRTLAVGVACLHAFIQENWTGPSLSTEPHNLILQQHAGQSISFAIDPSSLNIQAVSELAFGGEPAYHLVKKAALLRFAQIIFDIPYQRLRFVSWWKLRAMIVHQQLLDEPVGLADSFFVPIQGLSSLVHDDGDMLGRLLLEQGLLRHTLHDDRQAAQLFVQAARAMGLEYELTGALGKRTKFQQNEHSQLLLLAKSRDREDPNSKFEPAQVAEESKVLPTTLELNDDTLLEHTEFTSSTSTSANSALTDLDPGNQPALHPLDQSVLLSLCLNIHNTQPHHGLTAEQMAPYVNRVISHPRNWSVHTMALLLRARLESTRSRTVERSLLQLQALIDQMPTADSEPVERLLYIHDIPLPTTWELERELGIRYLSLGVVRSAMAIFERLEMWEDVVKCYQSLEQPEKGITIVRDLLEGRKAEVDTVLARGKADVPDARRAKIDLTREAKLWCLLGELEPERCKEHYTHAWELSNETSGRAARSLGGYHVARNEWDEAIPWLRRAALINPLMSRTWFLLGCAAAREEKWIDARDAFARCVSIDEDDAESWNNLASVYLRMSTSDSTALVKGDINQIERIPRENKILAFRALKHGLKFAYENWRMWQNYTVVCMDVGEYAEACRAMGRVVEELSEKRGADAVDLEVLEYLVDAVINPKSEPLPALNGEAPNPMEQVQSQNSGKGLYPRVADLFTRVILPRISSSPRIFRAYAKLLSWKQDEDWAFAAIEAQMNAYRASVVSDESVDTDYERWKLAVGEVEELIGALRTLGPQVTSKEGRADYNWQFQARSVLRSFMARTKKTFGDEPEWEKLTEQLDSLKSSS